MTGHPAVSPSSGGDMNRLAIRASWQLSTGVRVAMLDLS
jgi:hypothetical protein